MNERRLSEDNTRPIELTHDELAMLLASDARPVLLDCRTHAERELARIEGSLHLPISELEGRLGELRVHEECAIVVYCHHGVRSLAVTVALRQAGFDDVRSLAGGIEKWSIHIDATVPRY